MNSTPSPKATEPPDAQAAADERLTHAHREIKRADEQLARLTEQLERMERDAAPSARAASQPNSAKPGTQLTVVRAVQPSPSGKPSLQIVFGLALAAGIVVAALVWQLSYDDVAPVAPQLASSSSSPPENPSSRAQATSPAQPASSIVQVAAAEPAPPPNSSSPSSSPPASPPQALNLAQATPAQDAPPAAAAAAPPDQTQLLQTIARDLANLERTIDQLKTNQQQMADENAKAIGELKATQEEMKRALAKASEPGPPKVSAPATRPAAAARKPERAVQSPPPRPRPRYRREWIYDDDW
jgi:hypothetical protein